MSVIVSTGPAGPARVRVRAAAIAVAALLLPGAAAGAQTDYFNTDAGRPLAVQDASVIERHAFELQAAPLHVTRAGGRTAWAVEPELAWGALPFVQLELGLPIVAHQGTPDAPRGLAGVHLGLLYAVNTETRTLPAFAVGVAMLLPAGPLGADDAYHTVTGVATRTFSAGRLHVNASGTVGLAPVEGAEPAAVELSRWSVGVAADHAFPFQSTLVGAELVARQPLDAAAPVAWDAGIGLRRQLDPRWALDAGVGRTLTGDDRAWTFTLGAAYVFALPALVGGR
jgi:hypothetical protein